MQRIIEILNKKKKNFYISLAAFIVGDSLVEKVDGFLLTSSISQKSIVKVKLFVTTNTDDMYDHMEPTQRDFQPNVYISHVGAND